MKRKNKKTLFCVLIFGALSTARLFANENPPVNPNCHFGKLESSNGLFSLPYTGIYLRQETKVNSENGGTYSGEIDYGPVGEGGYFDYQRVTYVRSPEGKIVFKGAPLRDGPMFEIRIDRSSEKLYRGTVELSYRNGARELWDINCQE